MSRRAIDLTGKRFGRLVVQRRHGTNHDATWECLCDCGNRHVVNGNHLRRGATKSCGCGRVDCRVELVSRRFGYLVVTGGPHRNARGNWAWICLCDCGGTTEARTEALTGGNKTSCGCMCNRARYEVGNRYGRLTVIRYAGHDQHNGPKWLCRCDCGRDAVVLGTLLRSGQTISCGCYRREVARDRLKRIRQPMLMEAHHARNRSNSGGG